VRGFAVVASEIRKLAEKTDQHSKQIAKSLQTMKNLMDGASSSAEKSTAQFASVVNLTNKVKDENASIKGAIQEQSAGGRQVLEALAEMNTLTVRVKDEADALRQSSENVIEEMGKLTAI
jgi:methyl-accepting chemotaxis protein